jgi:hypothetical protein
MKMCLNRSGVALVLVLMIVVISAGLLAVVMYYTLSGSEISGLQRRYETSKEASLGAIDIFTKELIPSVLQNQAAGLSGVAAALTQGAGVVNSIAADSGRNACFLNKLTRSSANWGGGTCDTGTDPNVNSDITFRLVSTAGGQPFQVNLKIIDTVAGNSSLSGVTLEGAGVVETGSGTISVVPMPYLYTFVAEGRLPSNTTARANFETLYAY